MAWYVHRDGTLHSYRTTAAGIIILDHNKDPIGEILEADISKNGEMFASLSAASYFLQLMEQRIALDVAKEMHSRWVATKGYENYKYSLVKIPCVHCRDATDVVDATSCSYCYGDGYYLREWYYGLEGKVCKLLTNVKHSGMKRRGVALKKGRKVKVVMCSRDGDVGITTALGSDQGYSHRVDPKILEVVK